MSKRFSIISVLLFLVSGLHAQLGKTAYNFLDIPSSSHVYALGGTNITLIDDDISLVDQNPALLGPEIEKSVGFSYMRYMNSSNFAGFRYGMAAGERGAWAVGMRYLDFGEIQGYLPDGTATDSFRPADMVMEGTYSHDFTDRLRGGINLKMIYSHYEAYSAFAMAVDLGLNYYNEEKDLSFSVALKNAGGQIKRFDSAYDRLPFDIQFGYMQSIGESPFAISVTATHLTRWKLPYYSHSSDNNTSDTEYKSGFLPNFFRHLIFGLQYHPSEKFYIAVGYNYKTRTDMSAYQRNFFSGISLGMGLNVKAFKFGVAYAMPHKSASTIMLNLSCNFDSLLN